MSTEREWDEALAEYEICEAGSPKKKWRLSLYPDYFVLQSPKAETHQVDRVELRDRVQTLNDGILSRRILLVKLGKKRVMFQLSPEAFADVSEWIGPPTLEDLKLALRQRFSWVLPIGILFVVTALPIGGLPLEPVSLGLGLALILTGALAKLRPHRILFALDSLWFAVLAANSVRLLIDEWYWLHLVFLLLQLVLIHTGLHEYHRFAPARMAKEEEQFESNNGDT